MKKIGIIVAGGKGKRLGENIPKAFVSLNGFPLICYSLYSYLKSKEISSIIVVVPDGYELKTGNLINDNFRKEITIVKGGVERFQSVFSALNIVDDKKSIVSIHDSARPFITPKLIDESVIQCERYNKGVILSVKSKDTIKYVECSIISKTISRDNLYLAQTPQTFPYEIIYKSYLNLPDSFIPTDDAQVVELDNHNVRIIEGDYLNFKITTSADLKLAETIVKDSPRFKLPSDLFSPVIIPEDGVC